MSLIGLLYVVPAAGQTSSDMAYKTRASAPLPLRFGVVSIRPSKPGSGQSFTQNIQPDGYRARGQSMHNTIMVAYSPLNWVFWPREPLVGEPAWGTADLFDIEGKVAPEDIAAWQRQGNSPEQKTMLRAMLQAALAERCRLAVHIVPGQASGYALVVRKGGPKFHESPAGALPPEGGMQLPDGGKMVSEGDGRERFAGASMASFAWALSMISGGPAGTMPRIEDRTGLTGRYDLLLERRETGMGLESNPSPATAWDIRQIGLDLVPIKVPSEAVVIDHIEKPTEN